ncbi:glycosyltransferase family 8 protein [Ancylobacter sp. 6x-1]|uniref:Glycosyltransferase family 8 protein n=1 Tax=Ancylobacter crimeensis TaxID=2579147 RepID=A0ABT0DEM6_9HYPH|nr:glycosyltransferase family 8 protein [Ancylobacter crimeensis]MCK0198324.1 glycosyltransferase family 8 protein [Ancylobacter crimeensis]
MQRQAARCVDEGASSAGASGLVVVTVTDRTYVELTGIMLLSLARHGGADVAAVHVFGNDLGPADRARLAACHPGVVLHDLDAGVRDLLGRLVARAHVAPSAYARLLIPNLLPDIGGRLLYVDCDTLINAPLTPLAGLDLKGHAVAAVRDQRRDAHAEWNRRLGLPEATPYLNTGVLLIDAPAWRAAELTRRCLDVALAHGDRLRMMDQDTLNIALAGDWYELERRWNYYESSYTARRSNNVSGFTSAGIIHFVGRSKPNHADCRHPARAIYRAYRAQSPWAQAPLLNPTLRNIRVYAMETLRRSLRVGLRLLDRLRGRPVGLQGD